MGTLWRKCPTTVLLSLWPQLRTILRWVDNSVYVMKNILLYVPVRKWGSKQRAQRVNLEWIMIIPLSFRMLLSMFKVDILASICPEINPIWLWWSVECIIKFDSPLSRLAVGLLYMTITVLSSFFFHTHFIERWT